jgi:DNA polymerase alpha subunit A
MKTTASEMLCLKRGLKGPSWLRIEDAAPHQSKVSHARHTLAVETPGAISVADDLADRPSPPLTALCLSTKTVLNERTGAHELVMLSGVFLSEVPLDCALDPAVLVPGAVGTRDFVLLRPPDGVAVPFGFQDRTRASAVAGGGSVEIVPNEGALLNNFTAKLLQLDPDALLGHDILGFGLDVLLARMAARRTRKWSCLGRLVQSRELSGVVKNNASTSWFKAEAVAGRLVCDTYSSAKEIMYKEKDYSLSALSANVLGTKPSDQAFLPPATDIDNVPVAFGATDSLCRLVTECTSEARTAGRLSARLSILPLSKQLTCISGNLWSRTLQGARAQRIEFLLCHEFLKVGSKRGGEKSTAGNVTCKLLLPDKLTRLERAKLESMSGDGSGGGGVGVGAAPSPPGGKGAPARPALRSVATLRRRQRQDRVAARRRRRRRRRRRVATRARARVASRSTLAVLCWSRRRGCTTGTCCSSTSTRCIRPSSKSSTFALRR